tara:strand:- start:95 stop:514 length:420 start_codon:yes stop_codon:yes gene_type:complete
MSLNWDLTKIDDFESINTKAERGITDALIYMTIGCGLEEITAKNAPEWNFRLAMYQKVFGNMLQGGSDACAEREPHEQHERDCYASFPLTWQHVERRIGLSTNAFPSLSRTKWIRRLAENFDGDVARQTRRERAEVAAL